MIHKNLKVDLFGKLILDLTVLTEKETLDHWDFKILTKTGSSQQPKN